MNTQHFNVHTLAEIQELEPYKLQKLEADLAIVMDTLKLQLKNISDECGRRFAGDAKNQYDKSGKSHGKIFVEKCIDVPTGTELIVNATVTKKVDYTQTKLRELFGSLPIDEAQKYITVDFHVSETNYPKLQVYLKEYEQLAYGVGSDTLSKLLEESRIVKYSSPKISLELEND